MSITGRFQQRAARRTVHSQRLAELKGRKASLGEELERFPHRRLTLPRGVEWLILLGIAGGEVILANTFVQVLPLTATQVFAIAIVIGAAAAGLAWVHGHEQAVRIDPDATSRQSGFSKWIGPLIACFLLVNFAIRLLFANQAAQQNGQGSSFMTAFVGAALLTTATAVLMLFASWITANGMSGDEAAVRKELSGCRAEIKEAEGEILLLGLHGGGGDEPSSPTPPPPPGGGSAAAQLEWMTPSIETSGNGVGARQE